MSEQTLRSRVEAAIRDVPNFPKEGILFKDITPILLDPALCRAVADELAQSAHNVEAVVGVESRGFLFGMMMAERLQVPFITVRKAGKLPFHTISHSYNLEYGSATVEMHVDAVRPGMRCLVHDDLLATGGTAAAAAELIRKQGGLVAGFSFLVELSFLGGVAALGHFNAPVKSIVTY